MPMRTTMVRAGVAIRDSVTWPSVYTHRTWLSSGQSSPVCWECPASWEFDRCRSALRERARLASSGWVNKMTSASTTIPRMAETDRIAELNEVAVFLRRLGLRWLP